MANDRGDSEQLPNVTLEGVTYTAVELIGKGGKGSVFRASAGAGPDVCLKELRIDSEEQRAVLEMEVRIQEGIRKCAEAEPSGSCASVPRVIAFSGNHMALSLVGGMTLKSYLEQPRRHDAGDVESEMETVQAVCWIVVKKVVTLLKRAECMRFLHRDLHDGNVLVTVREPVTAMKDVDVFLIDFGKSMALDLNGQEIITPTRKNNFENTRINPTVDTVRLLTNIQRTAVRSYEAAYKGCSAGEAFLTPLPACITEEFLGRAMPFGDKMDKWLQHTKRVVPPEALTKAQALRAKDGCGDSAETGDLTPGGIGDTLVSFNRADRKFQAAIMQPYYALDKNHWFEGITLETLMKECPIES